MKTNLLIILIFNIINFISLKKSGLLSLTMYENSFVINNYNLTLLNIDDAKIKNNPSKLAYITDINKNDSEVYNYYSKYFNRIWLFYISDINQLKSVLYKDFRDYKILITGIIIPKSMNYTIVEDDNIINDDVPIIEIPNELNLTLEQYDFRKYSKNIFFVIKQINNLLVPKQYIIIFSIFVLVSSIIIALIWNIFEKRVGQIYIFNYHDKIKYIFCAHIFLALTLIFKTISIMRTDNYELTATVEISLTLSSSFFKSLLWFLIYLIAYGWHICFQELQLNEQKKLVRLLLIIVVNFWIDDILLKYLENIGILHLSEIKNLFLYIFLVYKTIKNIKKNMKILNRKYNYALSLLPEYADSIMSKIKLLSNLKIYIIIYLPLFILVLLVHKIFLYDYDSSILFIYDYLIPDFILEGLFVFLMRPKIVPNYYNVDLGEMFDEIEGETYECYLPKFDERFDDKEMISINIKDYDTDEIPVIIIGPKNECDNSNNSDNSDFIESDINKYFSNIQIGYYNSNK